MTQSSYFLTNGSSLEDCHTNFFALADLCGIKWRQYTCDKHCIDLDDPVLHSYIKCINADLLCVWRKVRNTQDQSNRIGQENCSKELWIFWYGDEPDFSDLIAPNLTDGEQGSFESGLSYECRTLLFKALHNLIERSLLSKGYARLGRWFFQVKYNADHKDTSDKLNDGTQVTFAFNFFLHGDSNVCANVDVRQHSAVYPISKEDIQAAQSIPGGLRVILAPYGLQAYLTGHTYKDSDQTVQKFVLEWKKTYPLSNANLRNSKDNSGLHISPHFNHLNSNDPKSIDGDYLNKIVEVIIGDHKLKYPVGYIFVTEADRKLRTFRSVKIDNNKNLSESMSQLNKKSDEILENNKLIMTPYYSQISTDTYCIKSNTNQANTFCDSLFLDKINHNREDNSNEFGHTLLNDLLLKKACNCQKCQQANLKKHLKSSNLNGVSYNPYSSSKSKDRSIEKEKAKYMKNSMPFHHRSLLTEDIDFTITTCSLIQSQTVSSPINSTVNINSNLNQSNVTPIIMSYKSPVSTSTSSILNTPGIESSPLSNFNLDNIEHQSPIASKDESTSINTPTNISNQLTQSPKDKVCLNSMSPNVNSLNNSENLNSNKIGENLVQNLDSIKQEATNQPQICASNDNLSEKSSLFLKRSLLYKNIYDGDHDLRHGLLYDFSCEADFWDLPPPKNRRIKDGSNIQNGYLIDLNRDFADSFIMSDLPQFKNKDPYEFNEEHEFSTKIINEENIENIETISTSENGTVDSAVNKMSKLKSENELFKNTLNAKLFSRNDDDFTNTFSDLEFFNSSGDESNENFQPPLTPKNTNGISTVVHDTDSFPSNLNNTSILGPAELSRMFPTPPSLEAMVQSPCNNYITTDSKNDRIDSVQESVDKKEQTLPNLADDDFKDCSFVYKPPIQSSFITSNKYAPLENVEYKQNIPSHCYYKHNVKKQQTMKSFGITSQISCQRGVNMITNKAATSYLHLTPNKMGAFPSPMIRSVRPTGQNMPPGLSPNPNYINRVRPPLNMQSQLYFPNDTFRQNSPMNIDGPSMSPMPNNFISSPLPNFDNRKSPYSFPQVSLNSPSNANPFISNSPMNNFNMQQKMSPMVGSNFYMNQNMENNFNSNMVGPLMYESNSVMLNLLLSDSMSNLFRDHNFDSCSICVCNMNIKGNDIGVYLPDSSQQQSNDYYKCTCGFSALSNRHLSQFSGLFYEDEVDITGIFYDPSEKSNDFPENNGFFDKELKKALSEVDENLINLILSLSTTVFPSISTLSKIINCENRSSFKTFNLKDNSFRLFERDPQKLIYKDFSDVVLLSLNMTRIDSTASSKPNMLLMTSNNISLSSSKPVLHDWAFRHSNYPVNNHDVIYMLKTLQPLMQEAVQRKGPSNEVTYNAVKGPLTWRQFHSLAGRGTEYQCEPQPIPSLLAGYDKDCVIVSPFAFKFWEKLSLEPYAITRDVGYIVLVPDNDYIFSTVKHFFKELSTTYELLRFGRHFPMRKLFRDGIFVVGQNNIKKCDSVSQDDWFNNLGESNMAAKIRLYAQACYSLVSSLSVYERSLFEAGTTKSFSEVPSSSFMNNNTSSMNGNLSNSFMSNSSGMSSFNNIPQRPINNFSHLPNSSESQIERLLNEIDNSHSANLDPTICQISTALQPYEDEDDSHKYPSIMIYIVDPFASYGKEAAKLGCVGLLKSFSNMLKFIPENIQNNIHLQLLSMDSIICNDKDFRNISRQSQLKELSFSIYSQCKQQLIFQPNIKSLTGLGPAASFEVFLKNKQSFSDKTQLYTTPFILAPLKDKQTELGEMFGDRREKSQILFCCYCLSEDQKWLLVSCTNDKGDILQSKMININVPNRPRRRNASVRRFGLDKLMNFVQTVMSESVLPWRLVIGRLGRIGHGELKDWTFLLSKKSLLKYSRQLREMCAQCGDLSPHDQPAIYSACLISLEADTALRVFPNYYTPDERFSSSCNTCSLSTPEDASCTHILVFPTSATSQFSHANFSIMDIGPNIAEEFFPNLDDSDIPVEDDIDFDNFWNDALLDEPGRNEPQLGSPSNLKSFGASNLKNSNILDDQDEPAQLLQQPLALAFYVSTARTGPLPRWFWANSPHLENNCPAFLKSALLIHTPFVQQNTDDLLHSTNRDCHSLDSSLTTDVLRCVLEGYNSLSWLALDPSTNDRMSCLPLHIQVLMQLYHSVQALI